jgi:hypothetical protein
MRRPYSAPIVNCIIAKYEPQPDCRQAQKTFLMEKTNPFVIKITTLILILKLAPRSSHPLAPS